ncbi:MAG TPA: phosphoribosyltransferase family protein [Solirubrobacteraceae bacterium]|nr:phosphoribosyltransferase family protein [Solirubrobacteraceae bacterium]
MGPRFRDRRDAGQQLAAALIHYRGRPEALVLGLPRGGVPVAFEVARALGAPMDVLLVRKLGVPYQPELALGAIASGVRVLDDRVVRDSGLGEREIEAITAAEERELLRREQAYRGAEGAQLAPLPLADRLAILVDDGLATGSSMMAAIAVLRRAEVRGVVVGVPVAAAETCPRLRAQVDELVCLHTPSPFRAVGLWYEDFSEVSDAEVRELLARARSGDSP